MLGRGLCKWVVCYCYCFVCREGGWMVKEEGDGLAFTSILLLWMGYFPFEWLEKLRD